MHPEIHPLSLATRPKSLRQKEKKTKENPLFPRNHVILAYIYFHFTGNPNSNEFNLVSQEK